MARKYFVLVAAIFVLVAGGVGLRAQTPIVEEPGYTPTLTFDVASIRLAPPPDAENHVTVTNSAHSSRLEATRLPLMAVLQMAYGFDAPIVGMPDWMKNTFYNIQLRSDAEADARLARLTDNEVRLEKRNAVRVLLAERLNLKTHLETRNSAIYYLVLAKGGVKMQAVPAPAADANGVVPVVTGANDIDARATKQGLEFVGKDAVMRAVSGPLSAMVEAPVIDKTGLTGSYNYTLQFGREWSARNEDSWPSIFTAVQEQLGLKLEPTHESVPNLVIDHITKPTEN